MEHVPGHSCAEILRDHGHLEVDQAVDVLSQACRGLDYAHRHGVVHRDVKPGNLLLSDAEVVKLADFGIARATDQSSITQVGSVLGTAAYLAPEQARGEEAGPRADLYSLGVVAYQLLSGRLPYEANSLSELALKQQRESPIPLDELNPRVPRTLARAVEMALAIDQTHRPADAMLLADDAAQRRPWGSTRFRRAPRPSISAPAAAPRPPRCCRHERDPTASTRMVTSAPRPPAAPRRSAAAPPRSQRPAGFPQAGRLPGVPAGAHGPALRRGPAPPEQSRRAPLPRAPAGCPAVRRRGGRGAEHRRRHFEQRRALPQGRLPRRPERDQPGPEPGQPVHEVAPRRRWRRPGAPRPSRPAARRRSPRAGGPSARR